MVDCWPSCMAQVPVLPLPVCVPGGRPGLQGALEALSTLTNLEDLLVRGNQFGVSSGGYGIPSKAWRPVIPFRNW